MSDTGKGTATAIAMAVEAMPEPEEPEQLDLLGLPMTIAGESLELRRGRGRPPGSRNKRTLAQAEFLLRQYADPRAVLLQIAQAPVDELVAKLGCTALEALQEKRLAAIGVLPYVAQRQPLAVDVTNRSVVYLTIQDGAAGPVESADITLSARVIETIENQEVTEEGKPDV